MHTYFISQIKQAIFYKTFLLSYALGKMIPPKFVVWDCTRRCNLNCEHCGAKKEHYPVELTTLEIKALLDRLSEYKIEYFMVTGGEPLIRPDLLEICTYAKNKGLKTGLATNGLLITKNNCLKISQIVDSIQISIDGPEKIHNAIRRNPQAFQQTIKAIKLLQNSKCQQLTISSVITRHNIDHISELAKILKGIKINFWKITTPMPIGNATKNRDLYLDESQFKKLLLFIEQNRHQFNMIVGDNLGFLGKYDRIVRKEAFFCPVGLLSCCIGVDGNVRGCPEQPDIPSFQEGNILKRDFSKIWEKGFKKYREREFLQDTDCQACSQKDKCKGGCWVMRRNKTHCPIKTYHL